MRNSRLGDRANNLRPVSPDNVSSRWGHTRNNRNQSTHSIAQGRNGDTAKVSSKNKAGAKEQRFGTLPLQQARVLQQLQSLSISSTSAVPADKAPSAALTKQFIPRRKAALVKQPKLRRSRVDPAGSTDSEVDSPLSQPVIRNHHSTKADLPRQPKASQSFPEIADACSYAEGVPAICSPVPSLLHLSLGSESASAVTPSRTALPAFPNCITDTPESMALSTPACGQALPSSSTSSVATMSCSTTGIQSANPVRTGVAAEVGSPMCTSPDTWATPHQLQWELSSHSLSAAQDSPQLPAKALSPSASQLHLANLQFGLDAIKDAAGTAVAGARRRSRLASRSTMADHSADLSETDISSERDLDGSERRSGCANWGLQSSDRGFRGFAEEAEWMEDLEVTPTPSEETVLVPSGDAGSPQAHLRLNLESDDDGSQQALGFQVTICKLPCVKTESCTAKQALCQAASGVTPYACLHSIPAAVCSECICHLEEM